MDPQPQEIVQQCLDSQGFVTFMAYVKDGTVHHFYNRSFLSFEDTYRALEYFRKHVDDDKAKMEVIPE